MNERVREWQRLEGKGGREAKGRREREKLDGGKKNVKIRGKKGV